MRAVVIGAVHSSHLTVERLCASGIIPQGIVTLPLALKQRHSDYVDLRPIARNHGIPLFECANSNNPDVVEWVLRHSPDHLFVVGWSQILSADFLSHDTLRVIGYHPSPLPRDRGRAVIPWTVLLGRSDTAGTLFNIDSGVDTGPILDQLVFSVSPEEDAESLYDKHCEALGQMLDRLLPRLQTGEVTGKVQDHSKATYCAKRTDEDGEIDWNQPAEKVARLIRATTRPYPGAFSFYREGRIRFWKCQVISEHPYIGLPGQIQAIEDDGLLVMSGDDRILKIKELSSEVGEKNQFGSFKIHAKFRRKRD